MNELLEKLLAESEHGPHTAHKAAWILSASEAVISGVILTIPGGRRVIIERGAARWLSNEEMQALMHPKQEGGAPCQS